MGTFDLLATLIRPAPPPEPPQLSYPPPARPRSAVRSGRGTLAWLDLQPWSIQKTPVPPTA
eukprot:529136-Prymnesium_polylepis.1